MLLATHDTFIGQRTCTLLSRASTPWFAIVPDADSISQLMGGWPPFSGQFGSEMMQTVPNSDPNLSFWPKSCLIRPNVFKIGPWLKCAEAVIGKCPTFRVVKPAVLTTVVPYGPFQNPGHLFSPGTNGQDDNLSRILEHPV